MIYCHLGFSGNAKFTINPIAAQTIPIKPVPEVIAVMSEGLKLKQNLLTDA